MGKNSRDYWQEREAENLKHYTQDETEYDRQIKAIYQRQLDSIQEQIDAFYGRYAQRENITLAEAKKRVAEHDVKAFERKAKRYVKEKNFSKRANEELRLYNATMRINRLEMLKANIGLELLAGTDELDSFLQKVLEGRAIDELKRQAGILGETVKNNAQKAHAIVNSSFHNATFSDRIWMHQDLLHNELNNMITSGLIQGKNPRTLARDLKKATGASTYNAERLMRTELARVQTEAQKQSFERNGFEEYMFIANSSCCEDCQALNGKHFNLAKMMHGENAPPLHPNCRCSTAAYEDSDEYEAWLDYLDKGGTTAEWNKQKGKRDAGAKSNPKAKPSQEKKISRIADTTSFKALEEYLKNAYDISVDDSVKSLDFGSIRDAIAGIESVLDKVPILSKIIKRVKTSKSGVMSCSGENITFNPYYFEKSEKIQKACVDMAAQRWWVKNASPASIGAHECAHVVEWIMLQQNPSYQYGWQRVDAWNKCTEAKRLVSQACKNIKKTEYGKGKRNADLISSISRYAQETASETMAEAFADIYANGVNANPLSLEIERLTMEALKSYEGGWEQ